MPWSIEGLGRASRRRLGWMRASRGRANCRWRARPGLRGLVEWDGRGPDGGCDPESGDGLADRSRAFVVLRDIRLRYMRSIAQGLAHEPTDPELPVFAQFVPLRRGVN